ncbi:RNA pseudouridine synthase [Phreatobacter aquaticus]|uniref:RNA pseudouridine synthase n=1 Tax=Phreatobacter aquaticus TaxID=2570229 RepID=A0A4D7QI00_9HYPH|nr:RNA pseudouridine synthase [Phreatobacter aquaticus]QCK84987.1 RNA pseudouridine synthase [Phreatobacter aquaticus]
MQAPSPTKPDHPSVPDPLGLIPRLLHRDASVLILDKPAGLPVHKGPGGGPNLADNLGALRFGLPRDPELAHRLDKETAGCLVLGRHHKALVRLADLFKRNEVKKTYWAVVEGGPAEDEGTIDLAMSPRDPKRGWWMKIDPQGQKATTLFRVLGRGEGRTWLALEPVTGRTHQLRLHCQAMGYPILGDPIYGSAPRHGGPGLHLLARSISLPFAPNKPAIAAEATVPSHMAAELAKCGFAPSP